MEKEIDEKTKEDFESGKTIVRVDNFGILLNKFDKLLEHVSKIERALYFVEDRQKELLAIIKEKFK